jgi:(1->4)-alpha-D-glucan 1-alpha-D-glucosylmutase
MKARPAVHASTYRLQIHRDFPLDAAAALVPYLKKLGVGAAYLSPIFTAVPGSTHGYDVCDPTRLNPEAGGEQGFARLAEALKAADMGCILDIVPNHMGSDPVHNPWWWDVLEKGPESPYADFFDIDWNSRIVGLRGKVLLPVLGTTYGEALENGDLHLGKRGDAWVVFYHDAPFPLCAESLARAFPMGGDQAARARELNAAPDALHEILEAQFYRLSSWKAALHEANYRRFFDVSTLLGVRMENEPVFEAVHALLRTLVRGGGVSGVRVDHVDGLREPAAYLARLRRLVAEENPGRPPYLLVEKILQEEESLPSDWPVEGTTGYEFLSDLNGLFIPARGLESLRLTARRFQGEPLPGRHEGGDEIAGKRLVLSRIMRSELNQLADQLVRLAEASRATRDFTRDDLRIGVRETMAALQVYRTYGRDGYLSPFDARMFEKAVSEAARANPWMDPSIFVFLRNIFLSFTESTALPEIPRADRLRFALRFQQTTGSVMAKGVEDTAFYRNPVLLSLNEVGSSPRLRGTSPARFHARMAARLRDFPLGMLATSTHDAKRGEDARARLNALAARGAEWRHALTRLSRQLESARRRTGLAPVDEYFLYQSLIGAWPMAAGGVPQPPDEEFHSRVEAGWLKAAREAKQRTDWVKPNEEYEAGLRDFLQEILRGPGFPAFSARFYPLLAACARDGMRFSLAQVAAKCAAPGIPDVYQGSEFWDLSMVDPDNRRPVDFEARAAALEAMAAYVDPEQEPKDRGAWAARLLESWHDGRIKQYVLARCLRWREKHAALFLQGNYEPLETTGAARAETLAFRRTLSRGELVVILPLRATTPGIGMALLPRPDSGRPFKHLFTGRQFAVRERGQRSGLDLAPLWKEFPAAWLWREV